MSQQHFNINKHADILYQILPAVYRQKDDNGDLKKFLSATGNLLDQVHQSLLQRYADIFPDSDDSFELDSQSWLLPYIAELFDANVFAPDTTGQRQEIANTIAWRKAKGTIKVIEDIAEAIGQLPVVVQEGFKRVATTARIGLPPLLPVTVYGYQNLNNYQTDFDNHQVNNTPDMAPMWTRHPGLNAGTVDLRCPAGAVQANENNPAAITTSIDDQSYRWRQSSLHGSPHCHRDKDGHVQSGLPMRGLTHQPYSNHWLPGQFDDPSVRTVDFRNPTWRQGHAHPRRVLLYTPLHQGFVLPKDPDRQFNWSANLLEDPDFLDKVEVTVDEHRVVVRNRSLDNKKMQPIAINNPVTLQQNGDGFPTQWHCEGLLFTDQITVQSGRISLDKCAVASLRVLSTDIDTPVINAQNCLINRLMAENGSVQLQYCTVLNHTIALKLNASDSIFNGPIGQSEAQNMLPATGCVRYSSIVSEQLVGDLKLFQNHRGVALFCHETFDLAQRGCGVLHPASATHITNGAADGAEMGAYHHLYLMARQQALVNKLKDFMPLGMQAVMVPDKSLNDLPGQINNT